jgi:hypothetical protein
VSSVVVDLVVSVVSVGTIDARRANVPKSSRVARLVRERWPRVAWSILTKHGQTWNVVVSA